MRQTENLPVNRESTVRLREDQSGRCLSERRGLRFFLVPSASTNTLVFSFACKPEVICGGQTSLNVTRALNISQASRR